MIIAKHTLHVNLLMPLAPVYMPQGIPLKPTKYCIIIIKKAEHNYNKCEFKIHACTFKCMVHTLHSNKYQGNYW